MSPAAVAPRRAVFLDRDGVLNRAVVRDRRPYPPASARDVEILPGVAEACATLARAGFRLVLVTNQPDVARGRQRRAVVDEINALLRDRLHLDEVRACFHDDDDACACRKPAPGMLLESARASGVDLRGSAIVGDRWRDIEAGRRAGCRTIFVDHGYDERRPDGADLVVHSLPDAVPWILAELSQSEEER